jgi:hypothetical protein
MPSPKLECQAKEPSLCRYHGTGSETYAATLKARLEVAGQAYKAAQHTSRAYAAFSLLRESQNSYYSTDKGLSELESMLDTPGISINQKIEAEKVYHSALAYRKVYEKNLNINTIFPPAPPAPYKRLPMGTGLIAEGITNISTFPLDKEIICNINWNSNLENLTLSYKEKNKEDVLIGQAKSLDEATRKATEWYNRNYNRK